MLSTTDRTEILRYKSKSENSLVKSQENSSLNLCLSAVRRVIKNAEHLQRKTLKRSLTIQREILVPLARTRKYTS